MTVRDNKRIAKNTLMLYIRMFIIMAVGLYTGRVVLHVLGQSDYGLNNVVAGFVSMMAYLNSVFIGTGQRFLSVALGKKDNDEVGKVFSTLLLVHIVLAIMILLFAETFGVWYVNNRLVIECGRLEAANWVFQCAICTLLINIVCVPFNSSIITHEHMHVYAYLSILQVSLNLTSVFAIQYFSTIDSLKLYALFGPLTTILTSVICFMYCRKHFFECRLKCYLDKKLIKNMSSYVGWSTLGSLGFTFKDQWINIVINHFCGTVVNAARGVAMHINGAVNQFSQNFVMAVTPPITKAFASGDKSYCRQLTYTSTKLSFFLMSLIFVPLIINLRYILDIWLVEVPEYAYEFALIVLCNTMLSLLAKPTTTVLLANGDIKFFQIGISIIFLTEVPLAYLFFSFGMPPYIVVLPSVLTQIAGIIFRFSLLHKIDTQYSYRDYYIGVVTRSLVVVCFATLFGLLLVRLFPSSFGYFLIESILSVLILVVMSLLFGLNGNERNTLSSYIRKIIHGRLNK